MCLHLSVALVTRFCTAHRDPGHDNNASWKWETIQTALRWLAYLIIGLLVLAVVLEYMRESSFLGIRVSREHTAVAIMIAAIIAIIVVLELICMFPELRGIWRQIKPTQDVIEGGVADDRMASGDEEGPPERPESAEREETGSTDSDVSITYHNWAIDDVTSGSSDYHHNGEKAEEDNSLEITLHPNNSTVLDVRSPSSSVGPIRDRATLPPPLLSPRTATPTRVVPRGGAKMD